MKIIILVFVLEVLLDCTAMCDKTFLWSYKCSGLNEKAHNIHKIWLHVAVCYEVYSEAHSRSVQEKKVKSCGSQGIKCYTLYRI